MWLEKNLEREGSGYGVQSLVSPGLWVPGEDSLPNETWARLSGLSWTALRQLAGKRGRILALLTNMRLMPPGLVFLLLKGLLLPAASDIWAMPQAGS